MPAIWWQRADGTGTAERLTKAERGVSHIPESWAPDGKRLLFSRAKRDRGVPLGALAAGGEDRAVRPTRPLDKADERRLFTRRSLGRLRQRRIGHRCRVSFSRFRRPAPSTRSRGGDVGHHALWSRDGKQLFYIPGPGRFVVVNVTTQPSFSVQRAGSSSTSVQYWQRANEPAKPRRRAGRPCAWDRGCRTDPSTPATPPQIDVVLNWFE